MNKEKEIEEMAKTIDYVIYQYSSDPNTPPDNNLSECIAYDLIVHGYGNVKQAVNEFAGMVFKEASEFLAKKHITSANELRQIIRHCEELYGAEE